MTTNFLENVLDQLLGSRVANEMTRLMADYHSAQAAEWLVTAIQPMADEFRAKLPELEQDKARAYANWQEAEKKNDGGGGERRVAAGRAAAGAHQLYLSIFREHQEIEVKLIRIEKILKNLREAAPPSAGTIQGLIRRSL